MKKIRVKTVVYDHTTMEFVARWTEREISDQLAEAILKEFSESTTPITSQGYGMADSQASSLRTLLRNEKRYQMDCQFAVIDTDEPDEEDGLYGYNKQTVCGWRGC